MYFVDSPSACALLFCIVVITCELITIGLVESMTGTKPGHCFRTNAIHVAIVS